MQFTKKRLFPYRNISVILGVSILCLCLFQSGLAQEEPEHPNAWHCEWTGGSCTWDYDLKPMTVLLDNGWNQTFYAYVEPDVSVFYNETPGSRTAMDNVFKGQFGKFVNMGPDTIRIYWTSENADAGDVYICDVDPFGSAGTAVYPGHIFKATSSSDTNQLLETFNIIQGQSVYVYNPFPSVAKAHKALSEQDFQFYSLQHNNVLFNEQYKRFTGRDWLALYTQKKPPRYHMWQAESFGQTHTITTKEIHFVELPTEQELGRGVSLYGPRPDDISRNRKHRDRYPTMNLTLKVLSCAPRVFEIKNFLSDIEIEHIMDLAKKETLERSATRAGVSGMESDESAGTRTSTNTWIGRHSTIITDAIYRRAADVLKIDESFLRYRRKLEKEHFTESMVSIAENLQLVHYAEGQEYTPHHDFHMPGLIHGQPSRFATILFYLNDEGLIGGETSFPLWSNAETQSALKIKPEKGKAILFYNLLPDGNFDEKSEHSSLPVYSGEKWLTNLWIWDPFFDFTYNSKA